MPITNITASGTYTDYGPITNPTTFSFTLSGTATFIAVGVSAAGTADSGSSGQHGGGGGGWDTATGYYISAYSSYVYAINCGDPTYGNDTFVDTLTDYNNSGGLAFVGGGAANGASGGIPYSDLGARGGTGGHGQGTQHTGGGGGAEGSANGVGNNGANSSGATGGAGGTLFNGNPGGGHGANANANGTAGINGGGGGCYTGHTPGAASGTQYFQVIFETSPFPHNPTVPLVINTGNTAINITVAPPDTIASSAPSYSLPSCYAELFWENEGLPCEAGFTPSITNPGGNIFVLTGIGRIETGISG